MVLNMRVNTYRAKSTVKENSHGLMDLLILANFTTIIFTERAFTLGLITEDTKENGEQIKCMAKALLFGLILESISVNTLKIKRRDTENSSGLMDGAIEESGLAVSSMGKVHI